jgi:APA family basic amino acid/polyamine antiporter
VSELTANRLVTTERVELVRALGLMDATTIVIGSMIGSGIFIVSADIARQVVSPAGLLLVWLVSGILTMIGALSYGELAAAMPNAGGQYVYLRESLGPMWGFLYGWALFLVIQTGTVAAVAIAFAKFAGVFLPFISSTNVLLHMGWLPFLNRPMDLTTQNLLAILSILGLTWVNMRGLRMGALVQNIFTFLKTAALAGLILLGFILGKNATAVEANFANFWHGVGFSGTTIRLIAVAMVGALFASDAWNNVTFTAGEVRDPSRNLPRSLALGTGIVCLLYLLANVSYLVMLPLQGSVAGTAVFERGIQYAAEDRVGAAAGQVIFGPVGLFVMAGAILISTFGCNNGLILAGARVYYAMARDGLFFRRLADLNPKYHTPNAALALQCVWACLLTLSGTYSQLLDYIIFTVLLFYILTIAGLFVLRRRRPEMERPYRAWGYPLLPLLYIGMAILIEVLLLRYKPLYTWPGLIFVVLGVPVYLLWHRKAASS